MIWKIIVLLILIVDYIDSDDDGGLTKMIETINNKKCSELLNNSNKIQREIYIFIKFPIINKIINNRTIYSLLGNRLTKVENSLLVIYKFITLTNFTNPTVLKHFLISLIQIDSSIKYVGFCDGDNLYHSNLTNVSKYVCRKETNKFIQLNVKKATNHSISYDLFMEPVFCSVEKNNNFLLRLIFSLNIHNKRIRLLFEFDLTYFQLDQCDVKLDRCKPLTTKCIYHLFPNRTIFSTGNYYCKCRKGFYNDQKDLTNLGFPGPLVEQEFQKYNPNDPVKSNYYRYNCKPCKPGCETCHNKMPCRVTYEAEVLRGLPLAIQSFCVTLCIVIGCGIFQLRRTRVIKSSHWILLELFLLGAIFMFCTIINIYFIPSEITCAIRPFLREMGFVLMYGVLYVKIYRVLCTFQSRKAQRVYVRDQDILRFLGLLVVICLGHLVAWLATGFDHKLSLEYTTFSHEQKLGNDPNAVITVVCRSKYWDVVSYFYEVFLLVLTIYCCKCVKSAPSEYGEVRFITIAVVNEFVIGLLVIVIRMSIAESVHPDYIFLINFIHCHATTTISVVLLIGPKLWYLYRPPVTASGRPRLIPHTDSHIIQTQQKLNGDVDLVEINLADMDPETIRDELKRLYTQLEIYKTRVMRKDNPHVSRKRGGRKQRRFSLQHFHKKHHTTSVHEDEPSKISEDSGGNSGAEDVNLTNLNTKQN